MDERARILKSLRERLEALRGFGWSAPAFLRAGSALESSRESDAAPPASRRVSQAPLPDAPVPAAAFGESPLPCAPLLAAGAAPLEREAKLAVLEPLRQEVQRCERCVLSKTRRQAVFGTGDVNARVFFVGEGPGFDEDRLGEPFVGKAGQLLDKIIHAMGLAREEVYIGNVVKCRPPNNRTPDPHEVASCRGYLEQQIETVRPEVIILLGVVASHTLLDTTLSLGRLRGRFHDYRGIPCMPTYHPAYLLRSPAEKRKTWEDIQQVMARLGLSAR